MAPTCCATASVSYEAEAEGMTAEDIIQKIMDTLLVP